MTTSGLMPLASKSTFDKTKQHLAAAFEAALARALWKEFVDDALSGGGSGAHAVSKKEYAEAAPVLAEGDPGSPPGPLVGQPEWRQLGAAGAESGGPAGRPLAGIATKCGHKPWHRLLQRARRCRR